MYTLITHTAVTWTLVGLIWVIQVVHYPLFAAVPAEAFPAYEQSHQQRITYLVAPLMLAEVILQAMLLMQGEQRLPSYSLWLGAALLAVIWLSTALWQVPLHARLSEQWNAELIRMLVATNWLRTIAWTARGILSVWWLICILGGVNSTR